MELHLQKICFIFVGILCALQANHIRKKKQVGTGVTFAFPGLNLLGGGIGGNNNGNIFGMQTFTRTIVSTVSTVTTASYRTCTTSMAALMPCAGRRKRDLDNQNDDGYDNIEPTPAMALIVGTTTISEPQAVSEYLDAHKLSSQSIIYPNDIVPPVEKVVENISEARSQGEAATVLYPSHDNPEQSEKLIQDDIDYTTTEIPILLDSTEEATTPNIMYGDGDNDSNDKARVGLGKTTTVTTVIRVTSVATTIATGTMATLTVVYSGCMPPSYPVSGIVCSP